MTQVIQKTNLEDNFRHDSFSRAIDIRPYLVMPEHRESEPTFIVPVSDVYKKIEDIQPHDIRQIYLSKEYIAMALRYFQQLPGKQYDRYTVEDFEQCRLRKEKVLKSGITYFDITLKSKKGGLDKSDRIEITEDLSKEMFQKVLSHAQSGEIPGAIEGYLRQLRFPMRAETRSGINLNLEIDLIREAGTGTNRRKFSISDFPYVIIGCQVQAQDFEKRRIGTEDLAAGNHDIDLLKGKAILINTSKELSQVAGKRKWAIRGLNAEAVTEAFENLAQVA
jgi:hypothetical protein